MKLTKPLLFRICCACSSTQGIFNVRCCGAKGDGQIDDLGAILAAGAVEHLSQATSIAGEKTLAYVNRAKLDEDFDLVRSHPEIQRLIGIGAQAEGQTDSGVGSAPNKSNRRISADETACVPEAQTLSEAAHRRRLGRRRR